MGPHGLCMQKIRPQKPAKKLKGHFLYLPILLYNTKLILMLSARARTYTPDRRSGEADFLAQNVFIVSLWNRLFKNFKIQNLGTLLGLSYFCQKSRNPDF